jgi:hypothetical protein
MNVRKMNKNDTKKLVTVGVIIQYFVIHNTIFPPRQFRPVHGPSSDLCIYQRSDDGSIIVLCYDRILNTYIC